MSITPDNQAVERREAIAQRLRSARENAGLSQGQVARELNVHRPTISEIEAGRRRVSADEMSRFAQMYGVSMDWLTGTQERSNDPVENRLLLAARELSHLKKDDLDRLINLLQTMRSND